MPAPTSFGHANAMSRTTLTRNEDFAHQIMAFSDADVGPWLAAAFAMFYRITGLNLGCGMNVAGCSWSDALAKMSKSEFFGNRIGATFAAFLRESVRQFEELDDADEAQEFTEDLFDVRDAKDLVSKPGARNLVAWGEEWPSIPQMAWFCTIMYCENIPFLVLRTKGRQVGAYDDWLSRQKTAGRGATLFNHMLNIASASDYTDVDISALNGLCCNGRKFLIEQAEFLSSAKDRKAASRWAASLPTFYTAHFEGDVQRIKQVVQASEEAYGSDSESEGDSEGEGDTGGKELPIHAAVAASGVVPVSHWPVTGSMMFPSADVTVSASEEQLAEPGVLLMRRPGSVDVGYILRTGLVEGVVGPLVQAVISQAAKAIEDAREHWTRAAPKPHPHLKNVAKDVYELLQELFCYHLKHYVDERGQRLPSASVVSWTGAGPVAETVVSAPAASISVSVWPRAVRSALAEAGIECPEPQCPDHDMSIERDAFDAQVAEAQISVASVLQVLSRYEKDKAIIRLSPNASLSSSSESGSRSPGAVVGAWDARERRFVALPASHAAHSAPPSAWTCLAPEMMVTIPALLRLALITSQGPAAYGAKRALMRLASLCGPDESGGIEEATHFVPGSRMRVMEDVTLPVRGPLGPVVAACGELARFLRDLDPWCTLPHPKGTWWLRGTLDAPGAPSGARDMTVWEQGDSISLEPKKGWAERSIDTCLCVTGRLDSSGRVRSVSGWKEWCSEPGRSLRMRRSRDSRPVLHIADISDDMATLAFVFGAQGLTCANPDKLAPVLGRGR